MNTASLPLQPESRLPRVRRGSGIDIRQGWRPPSVRIAARLERGWGVAGGGIVLQRGSWSVPVLRGLSAGQGPAFEVNHDR